MRYLLGEKQISEIEERKKYIYNVFKIYLLEKEKVGGFVVLESVPTNALDIFLIVGHTDEVFSYIRDNKKFINEKYIIVITCYAECIKSLDLTDKEVYISYQSQRYSLYRNGIDYGFGFKITDSELNLYNARQDDITKKLDMSFTKLK